MSLPQRVPERVPERVSRLRLNALVHPRGTRFSELHEPSILTFIGLFMIAQGKPAVMLEDEC